MDKENFRIKQKIKLKNKISISYKKDFLTFKEVNTIIQKFKIKNILIYIPLNYEINIYKFRRQLSKKCKIFIPFMQDKSLKIVKLRLPLFKKRFGILEPRNSLFDAKIQLAIVPIVGIDKDFKRIGHGNGFYDRFFGSLNYKPIIIFTQNIKGISKDKLTNSYDIKGDFYINPENKYYKKEIKNDNKYNAHINWNYFRFNYRIFYS